MVVAAALPPAAPPTAHLTALVAHSSGPHGWSTYRVRPGDTLGAIAARHGTSVGTLVARNHLRHPGMIYPGDRISVPRGAGSAAKSTPHRTTTSRTTHVVRSGETVSGIAVRYGVSTSSLLKANRLSATTLIYPGQKLVVRGSGSVAQRSTPARSSRPTTTTRTRTATYRIRSGDTLGAIAARYGTSADAIARASGISTSSLLQIGQKVRVPGKAKPRAQSTVKDSFAGVTYPKSVVGTARRNADRLAARHVPSRSTVRSMVVSTARRHGVDPRLALAISFQESGWNQRAVSPANAVGVMQIIPVAGDWASSLVGRDLDLLDAQDNITAGVVMLRALGRSTGDTRTTVAAYYQGLGSVQSRGMYTDTKRYVANVLALRRTM